MSFPQFMISALPTAQQPTDLYRQLQHKIHTKTKPLGSLGELEKIALQLGLIQNHTHLRTNQASLWVFAGDHGIAEEKVSAYPQEVTWQMVENFLQGGAAINVFAKHNHIQLKVVDAGVKHLFGERDNLLDCKIAQGTHNFSRTTAMTHAQCEQAIWQGKQLMQNCDSTVIGFGEMGIANTTSAAALMHAFTHVPIAECVGAGTGLDAEGLIHKAQVLTQSFAFHQQQSTPLEQPYQKLACWGGFEIAMMVGAILACAEQRKCIVIDGFIVTSALLVAHSICPQVLDYCVFAHQSHESGHATMLRFLNVKPILNLNLRLGEGTGAALAIPLVFAAAHFLNEMASFESAQVSTHL